MSEVATVVLDASVGVKWFKPERGQEAALDLMQRACDGEIVLVAPVHFAHELLSVIARHYGPGDVPAAWARLSSTGITLLSLTDALVDEAVAQCESLGCTFYDALAPACAVLLGATLASADVRAHGGFPEVFLVE